MDMDMLQECHLGNVDITPAVLSKSEKNPWISEDRVKIPNS